MRKTFATTVVLLTFSAAIALAGCSGPSSSSMSISLSASASSLLAGQGANINANVTGLPAASGQNATTAYPAATWTLTPAVGNITCPPPFAHLPSEYACYSVNYAAPVAVSSATPVTITATLATNPPQSASVTITIKPTALYGWFSFLFSGFDANGAVSTAGAFSVDQNGNISGEEDFKDALTQNPSLQPITGSCQNSIAYTGFCTVTAGGKTFQYKFVLRSDLGLARFIEDSADGLGISGSGTFAPYSPASAADAQQVNYLTFGLVGNDAAGARLGMAGTASFQAGSLSGTGQADLNDGGTLVQSSSMPNVTVANTAIDNSGRQEMQITFASSPQQSFTLAIYRHSSVGASGPGFAIDVSPAPAGARTKVLAGQFFTTETQPNFDNTSFSGSSIFELEGLTSGGIATSIGALSPSSSPNLLMDTNLAGSVNGGAGGSAPETGSISGLNVATNGRAQFSMVVGATTSSYVAYLDAPNIGFLLGTDPNVNFGFLQAQASAINFSKACIGLSTLDCAIVGEYVTGTFLPVNAAAPNTFGTTAMLAPFEQNGTISTGPLSFGTTTGFYSFDPSTGRGMVSTTGGTILGNSSAVFYFIDPTDIVLMGSQEGLTNNSIEFLAR